MRRHLLGLSFTTLLALNAFAEGPRFLYEGALTPVNETFEFIPPTSGSKGKVIFGGDAFYEARFCQPDEPFVCVFTVNLQFAVPRDLGSQDHWEYDGHKFEVIQRGLSRSLFGKELNDLSLICTPPQSEFSYDQDSTQFNFLYSPKYGLVAFSWKRASAGGTTAFWSQANVGFGRITD